MLSALIWKIGSPVCWLARLSTLALDWERAIELRRQRRALLALDDRMLKDIGVTRADAEREVRRGWH